MINKATFSLFSSKNDFKQSFSTKIINKPIEIPIIIENKENIRNSNAENTNIFEKKRLSALDKLKKSLSSNLYQILQITPTSDTQEIKKAFKRLSLKFHPDKNKTCNKEEFHMVMYAYKILGNVELRKIYDEQGIEITDMILTMYEGNGQNLVQEL